MPGKPPYYRRFPRDIDADGVCEAMTAEQFGVYNRLLDKAWFEEPGGTVPDDDAVLARWGRITLTRWRKIKPGIMAAFVEDGGRWRQKRMAQDHAELTDELERKSRGGKRSAELRSQEHDSSKTLGKTLAKTQGNSEGATCASASGYVSESLSSPNGVGGAGEGATGPPTDNFDLSPERLAQEWSHVHRGSIPSQRDPYKIAEEFREWMRHGVTPEAIRMAIDDPKRDRTEAVFQLKSRLIPKGRPASPEPGGLSFGQRVAGLLAERPNGPATSTAAAYGAWADRLSRVLGWSNSEAVQRVAEWFRSLTRHNATPAELDAAADDLAARTDKIFPGDMLPAINASIRRQREQAASAAKQAAAVKARDGPDEPRATPEEVRAKVREAKARIGRAV